VQKLFSDERDSDSEAREQRGKRRRWLPPADREPLVRPYRRAGRITFYLLLGLSAVFGVMCGLMLVYSIDLPQMDDLVKYRPATTTELYDVHGRIFGSFALERRVVVPYTEFPVALRQAIISIEDKSFESNWGVNLFRAIGAAYRDLHSKGRVQGASTLTMQLARNLFLSSEKTYGRKIQEVFLSMQIERRFTKDQIFALYANQIYLGHGTFGFEAGSEFYFSKHVRDLTLPEAALLAALPKGPEYYSPIRNPERALRRRNLVLSEMEHDRKITAAQAAAAEAAPLGLRIETPANSVAPYFVEEVRRQLEKQYGVEEVHGAGLRVDTTLDLNLQAVANQAVLDGTATYERRRGWKGNLQNVVLAGLDPEIYRHPDWAQPVVPGSYFHALVTEVQAERVTLKIGARKAVLTPKDWAWTQFPTGDSFLKNGDLVYVKVTGEQGDGAEHVLLEQDTGAQASLMAVDNSTGEVVAMVGGRDFALSQFNRATQAQRQVGSSFKPYVYTTAVEAGAKPTDIIVDGPTTFPTPGGPYTPHNYEGDYKGPMTLLNAFAESRNIPALKLADRVGIRKVIATAHRFGITSEIPPFLPVAIGSADITLAEQVGAYSVFPNDGIRIEPHYIRRVTQADGVPLEEVSPGVDEVIAVETARTMMQFLEAVVAHGTGATASQLHHPLGGKTGTTNDFTDAWFLGFSPSVTCGTWIGFDDRTSLGDKETGARAALPIWIDFMRVAIAGKPDEQFATAGAPKKELDVPVAPVVPVHRVAPERAPDDEPDAGEPAPAGQAPVASPASNSGGHAPVSVPAAPTDAPATPKNVPAVPKSVPVAPPKGPSGNGPARAALRVRLEGAAAERKVIAPALVR
jgi:penicillin-binding protein 1A